MSLFQYIYLTLHRCARPAARRRRIGVAMLLPLSLLLGGCFTGIESTKSIKLTKDDRKAIAPTEEELYLASVKATSSDEWPEGKMFIVAGDRGSVLFEPREVVSGNYTLAVGDTLRFETARTVTQPDGRKVIGLTFRRGFDRFCYIPGQSASASVMSDAMPGVVDPEMVVAVDRLLAGKTLWTRADIWATPDGERLQGRRFERVVVKAVTPGDMVFPLRVVFADENGDEATMLMNYGNAGKDSRGFANLFMLHDPRSNYSQISDSNWDNIRRGKVVRGMTKEECRLAKGNPAEVSTGHDYSHALLIWGYTDGTVLYFVDGVLQGINDVPKLY